MYKPIIFAPSLAIEFRSTSSRIVNSASAPVFIIDSFKDVIISEFGASTVATDLTAPSSGDWADGATHTFKIMVSAAGVVTYELDDTAPTGAVAFTFDNAEVVTPYWFHRHDSDVGGAVIWQTFEYGLQ